MTVSTESLAEYECREDGGKEVLLMKDNGHIYSKYVNHNQETRWATREEIESAGTYVDFSADTFPAAGLPLLSNGREAYVDGKDTHTLIFGATGSKKTRLFCMPMLNIFAGAGESFIATDPKGELYAKTSGYAKSKGYNIVTINFRDLAKGDMWNPLSVPYQLYKSGRTDEATAMLNDFVATIAEPHVKNSKDVYWPEAASSLALANLLLLMECGRPEEINMTSLARLSSQDVESKLRVLSDDMSDSSLCAINYKGVLTAPENTLRCIYSTLFSMVRIFVAQKNLATKLAGNTIDMRSFGKQKTAVYIIVPDEKTTYHFLVTTFIKQVYETLIDEAQRMPDKRLPVRVNFVLDEFCNIPKIPDMPSMISAARSRNMRFYLIAQSYHQLKSKYEEDSDTIKGNCYNWVFLTSKELSLLQEISALCGSTYSGGDRARRLISVSELQRFNKEKGETLIMHARQYPMITEIADIDTYEVFRGYAPVAEPDRREVKYSVFDVAVLARRASNGKCVVPFSDEWEKEIAKGKKINYFEDSQQSVEDAEREAGFVPTPKKPAFQPPFKRFASFFDDDDDTFGEDDEEDVSDKKKDDAPVDSGISGMFDSLRKKAEELNERRKRLIAKMNEPSESTEYEPKPVDTSDVVLPDHVLALSEKLAKNTHEVWSKTRMEQGWVFGENRNDAERQHPCLVDYESLPESEKEYDRNTALETLRLIMKLGYKIEKPNSDSND